MAFAPVSLTQCYVQEKVEFTGDVDIVNIYSLTTTTKTYLDFATYTDNPDLYRFDAIQIDGRDHLYYTDDQTGRVRVAVVTNGVVSESKALLSIDVVDEDNVFELCQASVINGAAVVAGFLRRDNSYHLAAYTMGPDYYTLGREAFLQLDKRGTSEDFFLIFQIDDTVIALTDTRAVYGPATNLWGYDHADLKLQTSDIFSFRTGFATGQMAQLQLGLKSDLAHDAIREGSEILIELGIDNGTGTYQWTTLATYGVDALSTVQHESGFEQVVVGRAMGMKRLAQWNADAFYDYWSQAKQDSDPADLGRFDVDEDEAETPLYMPRLNEDGIMYSVAKSSRGYKARAKFMKDSNVSDYSPTYGLYLNYYRDNRQEAADRLGIDYEDVTEDQYGHYGLKVVWGDTEGPGGFPGVHVYLTVAGTDVDLGISALLNAPNNLYHWLQAEFSEGHLRVMYREDTDVAWTEVLESMIFNTDLDYFPWYKEGRGRAGVYMNNTTIFSPTPGFTSTSDIIPVESVLQFPASETVQVDQEIIDYSGTVDAASIPTTMTWAEGYTFIEADHDNTLWDNILMFAQSWNTGAAGEMNIGKVTTECGMFGQAFRGPYPNGRIDKIRIPAKTVGDPIGSGITLYCYFVTDAFDEANHLGTNVLFTCPMTSSISSEFGWIEFDFAASGVLRNGTPDRFIDPSYDDINKAYWIWITTIPWSAGTLDIGNGAYYDVANHYVVDLDETLGAGADYRGKGISLLRINVGGWKWRRYHKDYGPSDALMPFEIIGKTPLPLDAYEIYLQDADSPVTYNEDAFTNMALVCTDGPGAGLAYRIVYYDGQAPDQWVPNRTYLPPDTWQDHVGDPTEGAWETPDLRRIFISNRPHAFGEGSTFEIYPSLLIETRGVDDTNITSHGSTNVSIYRDESIFLDFFECYSSEIDMRLEDMAYELVRKAGVLEFSSNKTISGSYATTGAGWEVMAGAARKNCILKFEMPSLDANEEMGVFFRAPTAAISGNAYVVSIDDSNNLNFYIFAGGVPTLTSQYPLHWTPTGTVTVSVQGDHFSVWIADRYIHTFFDATYQPSTSVVYAGFLADGEVTATVDLSETDVLVDNFVLDMGHRGTQLLGGLIGPRRYFFMDTPTGGIRIGKMRSSGSADYEAKNLTVERTGTNFDGAITRVRAEGAIDDAKAAVSVIAPTGFFDPRLEPEDIISIGDDTIIVDAVQVTMQANDKEAMLSMDVEGRDAST
ncbi:MAG: hypothetical protein ACYTEW_23255 [Planctomycetota bacterium]